MESSSEKLAAQFMAEGRPEGGADENGKTTMLGGFEILTPKVGDGFVEWAVSGYDLCGTHKDAPAGVNYDKHGDWTFDKSVVVRPSDEEALNDDNYATRKKR